MHVKPTQQPKELDETLLTEIVFADTFVYLRNKLSIYHSSFKTLIH